MIGADVEVKPTRLSSSMENKPDLAREDPTLPRPPASASPEIRLSSIPLPAIVFDEAGAVVDHNSGGAALLPAVGPGKSAAAAHPRFRDTEWLRLQRAVKEAFLRRENLQCRLLGRDRGHDIGFLFSLNPFVVENRGRFCLALASETDRHEAGQWKIPAIDEAFAWVLRESGTVLCWLDAVSGQVFPFPSHLAGAGETQRPRAYTFEGWLELFHPEDRERIERAFRMLVRQELSDIEMEVRLAPRTETAEPVLLRGRHKEPGPPGQPGLIQVFFRKLTGGPEASSGRRNLASERNRLLDCLPYPALLLSSAERAIRFANREALTLLQTRLDDLVGRSFFDLIPERGRSLFPDSIFNSPSGDAASASKIHQEILAGSGPPLPVEISACRLSTQDLNTFVVVLRDLRERRSLEEQLRHSQRLEAVGRLATGIAHDFNNLLAGIMGFAEILLKEDRTSPEQSPYVSEIIKTASRASSLSRRLLAFSREKGVQPQVVDLNSVIADLVPMLHRLLRGNVELETRLAESLDLIKVDPSHLEQVLLNLVINAQEAIEGAGRITLLTRNRRIDESEVGPANPLRPGHYVELEVRDTGTGIPAEIQDQVFDPFFTTKKGFGTGLGLAIVQGIVRQSFGHIDLSSAPGQGTSFLLRFPRSEEKVTEVDLPPDNQAPRQGSETILVAEDQGQVLDMLRIALAGNGYRILEARNGVEALEVARSHEGPVDLLLTDGTMPRMGGIELANTFQEEFPETAVILMSGYTRESSNEEDWPANIRVFIEKPFPIRELEHKIREIFNARASGQSPGLQPAE
ncbi:MAG: response regulator [Puniceicoccaceae bacterium]|nr:MAG: response regulator [Puniceicoccaceae bacterium]